MKKIFLLLAVVLSFVEASAQNQHLIDSLTTKLKTLQDEKANLRKNVASIADTFIVKTLYNIASAYLQANSDKAVAYANQCETLSEQIGYKRGIALANIILGLVGHNKGNYFSAIEHHKKALKNWDVIKNKSGVAGAYNNIGSELQNLGNIPEALKNFFTALKINEEQGNKPWQSINLNNIGNIYYSQNNFDEALKYYSASLKIAQETNNKMSICNAYNNIGNVYIANGNNAEALNNYNASLKIGEELNYPQAIAANNINLGLIYYAEKNFPEALKYLLLSLKINEELGNKQGIANSSNNIGATYTQEKKYKEAAEFLNKGLALNIEIGNLNGMKESYKKLADLDSSQGNFNKAFEHYKLFVTARDSLINTENTRKTVTMQMNYDFDKKQDSIYAIQDKKDALAKTEIEKQKLRNELLAKQYDDSLTQKEHEKQLTALNMQYAFDKTQDSTKAEQRKKDAIADKKLQRQRLLRNGFIAGFGIVLLFSLVVFRQRNKIKKGKKLSDELLLNILPSEVAEELKSKGEADAKQFDEVTVMFTDFKGFTQISEKLTPSELVAEIHTCFKAFDNIITKYNIEKIKTIGDAYMCAGGLPVANTTNAVDVVNAALEIQNFMLEHLEQRKREGKELFEIRIGIHTGAVVAGIVGVKKFAYDIWGDTVNIASRMESSGEAGKVNISGKTFELVKEKFKCEHRGKISAKNKGEIDMYFVESVT